MEECIIRYNSILANRHAMDHHDDDDDDDDDDCMNSSELSVDDSFIAVLHAIVSDESLDSAIHWMPCGKKFIVANREEFVRLVLSQNNFGSRRGTSSTKYTSFTRRLKRWNFSRTASGRDIGAYHHEFFLKGEPELVKKIVLLKKEPTQGKSSSAPHTPGMKGTKKRKPRRATTGSLTPFTPVPDNKTTGHDMEDWLSGTTIVMDDEFELGLSTATEKSTSWANFVNQPMTFSSNTTSAGHALGIPMKPMVRRATVDATNPMVSKSHQLLMQQLVQLKQQKMAIQQLQLQQQLKKNLVLMNHSGSSHSGSNLSGLSSFDMSRTGTFAVPTKMYQDEVVPQEGQGRPKKRLSLGSLNDKFDLFGMKQVYASTGNITNSKSLASIVTAESTGGGGFKDNDQFPIFGMNSTSSAVTSTATNFTPSSVDSLMTLYMPHRQKQTWGCELCEELPLQNVADCCDSDGEDSIDAFFKDFKCTDPLNGNSSNSLCLFTTDQAGKFGEL